MYIRVMEGFVYEWTNTKNGMKYIGSHKGTIDDGYIGSGVYFLRSYNKEPNIFVRTIIYTGSNFRQVEEDILMELDVKNNPLYYNLKNTSIGGWEHAHNNEEIKLKRNTSISKSKKGRPRKTGINDLRFGEKNGMFGKKHKDTSIKIIVDKAKQRDHKYLWKSVLLLPDNISFDNIHIAAEKLGLTQPTISHHLSKNETIKRGKLKGKKLEYATRI